jgi:hypothetical protein
MSFAFPGNAHVFVDESKSNGYYLAAAIAAPSTITATRTVIASLRHKGSRSVHFKNEKDTQRHAFLKGLAEANIDVVVYVVRGQTDKIARTRCLEALMNDLCVNHAQRLVLDQDDSLAAADRRLISERLRSSNYPDLVYTHQKTREEPLLWVSDAVAWCYQKGGPWIAEASPLVADVRRL